MNRSEEDFRPLMRFVKIENVSLLDKDISGLRKESFLKDSKDR